VPLTLPKQLPEVSEEIEPQTSGETSSMALTAQQAQIEKSIYSSKKKNCYQAGKNVPINGLGNRRQNIIKNTEALSVYLSIVDKFS
jgi:hypothetical protein